MRPTWPEKQSLIRQSNTSSESTSKGQSCKISTGSTGRCDQRLKGSTQWARGPAADIHKDAPEAAALETSRDSAEDGINTKGEKIEGGKGNPYPGRMAKADADRLGRC